MMAVYVRVHQIFNILNTIHAKEMIHDRQVPHEEVLHL